MALGANRTEVLRLVVTNGLRMTFAGLGIGIVAALGLTRASGRANLRRKA